MSRPWFSADDIADYLDATKATIYVWISDKGLPAIKVGLIRQFQASEADDRVRGAAARGGA